ncbi:hypothetical protein TAMA11512_19530 [Selenomonas sp. TAMA-11512]|uniref:coenzyme F(420) biosynthesis enzyme n=1 Tax=Selenomonas sp. TAMA-11512 TaxID=3095337 RepID=UPI00308F58C8|nr:hypothetical protein TAMA11512_19530 [Selenomonas sp. TAMA-11512]
MKKIVQFMLFLGLMVLFVPTALANASKENVVEGADLTNVRRIAIAAPLYTPVKDDPTKEQLLQYAYGARDVARTYVVSYDEVVADILKDTGIDIQSLDRREAAKAYRDYVGRVADAYVVITVANNSRTVFFFDLYRAGTNELLYTFQIAANRSQEDNEETYTILSEQFYKNFERAANRQLKNKD